MKVVADRTRCIGAGQCVRVAPEIFGQDDEEGLVIVNGSIGPGALELLLLAEKTCPTRAIQIVADEDNSS